MLNHLLRVVFTYYPPSSAVARTYADNANRPLVRLLTPLRLAYYLYLLLIAIRLCLNSLLREAYHQYDLTVYLLERTISHHTAGIVFLPILMLAFVLDVTLVLCPHPKVAPMLVDMLQSEGKKKTTL